MNKRHRRIRGFTIVELLVVISILALLVALLVPALWAATESGERADSVNRLRQIAGWSRLYSQDNKTFLVPSSFNYGGASYPGKVRSNSSNDGYSLNQGTWTDILWAGYADLSFPRMVTVLEHDYSLDSPDHAFYLVNEDFDENPFRSAKLNTKGDTRHQGFFAANEFFNADSSSPDFNGWFTSGQIVAPDRSLFAIDSFVGEVISKDEYDGIGPPITIEVDFRYQGEALILFLDGHVGAEGEFDDLAELETVRKVKVQDLTRR